MYLSTNIWKIAEYVYMYCIATIMFGYFRLAVLFKYDNQELKENKFFRFFNSLYLFKIFATHDEHFWPRDNISIWNGGYKFYGKNCPNCKLKMY